jgi:hypothetical protein
MSKPVRARRLTQGEDQYLLRRVRLGRHDTVRSTLTRPADPRIWRGEGNAPGASLARCVAAGGGRVARSAGAPAGPGRRGPAEAHLHHREPLGSLDGAAVAPVIDNGRIDGL